MPQLRRSTRQVLFGDPPGGSTAFPVLLILVGVVPIHPAVADTQLAG